MWGRNKCVTNEPQRTSAGRLQRNPIKGISKQFPLWTKGTRRVTVVNATYRKSRKSPPRTKFRRGVDFLADKRSKKIGCSSALISMYIPTVVLTFPDTNETNCYDKIDKFDIRESFRLLVLVFRSTGVGVRGSSVPRCSPSPFFICHFWQKRYSFRTPSIENGVPFSH